MRPSRPLEPNPPVTLSSFARSLQHEQASTERLAAYVYDNAPQESSQDRSKREVILIDVNALFKEWIKELAVSRGVHPDYETAAEAGGRIVISGSYRDTILVPATSTLSGLCPKFASKDAFFTSFVDKLRSHPLLERINPLTEARIAIIELLVAGVSINMGFCRLATSTVPPDINILDDSILAGVDFFDQVALNGPRVTELICRLVPKFETFTVVAQVLRLWAKRRGLYSNKLGFLGGVNIDILAAYICQLYPNYTPAAMIFRFFWVFAQYQWPKPIWITKPYQVPSLGFEMWNPADLKTRAHVMPIITPAYPAANSSYNVSISTLRVMCSKFMRGLSVCGEIMIEPDASKHDWGKLFQPSDFFVRYDNYLLLELRANDDEDLHQWSNYVESRVRKLVDIMEKEQLPLAGVRPWHKCEERTETLEVKEEPVEDGLAAASAVGDGEQALTSTPATAGSNAREQQHLLPNKPAMKKRMVGRTVKCFYVGLEPDTEGIKRSSLNLAPALRLFKSTKVFSGQWTKWKEGMGLQQRAIQWKELPDDVFHEGRELAVIQWQQLREAKVKQMKEFEAMVAAQKISAKSVLSQPSATAMSAAAGGGTRTAATSESAPAPARKFAVKIVSSAGTSAEIHRSALSHAPSSTPVSAITSQPGLQTAAPGARPTVMPSPSSLGPDPAAVTGLPDAAASSSANSIRRRQKRLASEMEDDSVERWVPGNQARAASVLAAASAAMPGVDSDDTRDWFDNALHAATMATVSSGLGLEAPSASNGTTHAVGQSATPATTAAAGCVAGKAAAPAPGVKSFRSSARTSALAPPYAPGARPTVMPSPPSLGPGPAVVTGPPSSARPTPQSRTRSAFERADAGEGAAHLPAPPKSVSAAWLSAAAAPYVPMAEPQPSSTIADAHGGDLVSTAYLEGLGLETPIAPGSALPEFDFAVAVIPEHLAQKRGAPVKYKVTLRQADIDHGHGSGLNFVDHSGSATRTPIALADLERALGAGEVAVSADAADRAYASPTTGGNAGAGADFVSTATSAALVATAAAVGTATPLLTPSPGVVAAGSGTVAAESKLRFAPSAPDHVSAALQLGDDTWEWLQNDIQYEISSTTIARADFGLGLWPGPSTGAASEAAAELLRWELDATRLEKEALQRELMLLRGGNPLRSIWSS